MKRLGRQHTLLLGFLVSFSLSSQSFSQEASASASVYESPYETVAKRMDLFGGLYYDGDGVLNLLLATGATSTPLREIFLSPAELTRVENIITGVFGAEFLLPVKDGPGPADVSTLRVRSSKYKWIQLKQWKTQIESSPMSVASLTATGIGERNDLMVISIGLEKSTGPAVNEIENLLKQLAIPRDAVVIEEVGKAYGANGEIFPQRGFFALYPT